ncbi:MAG: P-II family nitrogen regulator [Nitrososphaera sp.]|jgi:nitrogen regulatory protein PII
MAREKLSLPFEVEYSEKPGKKSKNMKRLAIIVKPENVNAITSSLSEVGLDSTIYDVKRATKDKEKVMTGRGSGTAELAYSNRKLIATVVNADDVEGVTSRIKKALDGDKAVVLISAVDDLVII